MTSAVRVLDSDELSGFTQFTFPAYRPQMIAEGPSPIVAVGLFAGGAPAGLALGAVSSTDPTRGEALSLFVSRPRRGRGEGQKLLEEFEQATRRKGCRQLKGSLSGSDDRSLAVERLLERTGWQIHGPSAVLCRASGTALLDMPGFARARLPPGMEIFPWLELSARERIEMFERTQREPWFPELLSPFWNETLIAPCSVGLRSRGRVVGWCVVYRFEADVVRWCRLFVEHGLQRRGRAIPLIAETARRGREFGLHQAVWSVSADNGPMMNLMLRRMRPYLTSARPVWLVTKTLDRRSL